MILTSLIMIPIIGLLILSLVITYDVTTKTSLLKTIALSITIVDLAVSLVIFILFDQTSIHFQFVQEHYQIAHYDFYLGVDGISIYFVMLTTIIMPIAIISN